MKTMQQTIVAIFLTVLLYACNQNASKLNSNVQLPEQQAVSQTYANEPDGFRDVQWGTTLIFNNDFQRLSKKQLTNDEAMGPDFYFNLECIQSGGGYLAFTRKNDKLEFGDTKISSIRYSTCGSKLSGVIIRGDNYMIFEEVKAALFSKFGPPSKSENETNSEWPDGHSNDMFFETFTWEGTKTNITYSYMHIPPKNRWLHEKEKPMTLTFKSTDFAKKAEKGGKEMSNIRSEREAQRAREAGKDF
jgi:hypothetical protein